MIYALDIGGTNTKYAYFEKDEIITQGTFKTVFALNELIEKVLSLMPNDCEIITISTGGFWQNNISSGFETVKEMADGNFAKILHNKTNCPVYIDNDAHCSLRAEMNMGKLKGTQNCAVVTLGTSVGCAVAVNGQIYCGNNGQAASLFMMPELYDGFKYQSDKYANSKKMSLLFGGEDYVGDFKRVCNSVADGNIKALECVNIYAKTVALKLFYLIAMYDPKTIVISGAIANDKFVKLKITNELDNFLSMNNLNKNIDIQLSDIGPQSNLYGAFINGTMSNNK